VVVVLEEVVVEDARYTDEEFGVDALPLEDGIYVGTFAAQLFREPGGCPFLLAKFFFDEFSDVYHAQI